MKKRGFREGEKSRRNFPLPSNAQRCAMPEFEFLWHADSKKFKFFLNFLKTIQLGIQSAWIERKSSLVVGIHQPPPRKRPAASAFRPNCHTAACLTVWFPGFKFEPSSWVSERYLLCLEARIHAILLCDRCG